MPLRLTLPQASVTVEQLITHKVRQEVAECLTQQRPGLSGEYVPPEALIRADRTALQPGPVAAEITRAQQAFVERAYMIVVDNQRVLDPHTVLTLQPHSQVEFIKILPLVGG